MTYEFDVLMDLCDICRTVSCIKATLGRRDISFQADERVTKVVITTNYDLAEDDIRTIAQAIRRHYMSVYVGCRVVLSRGHKMNRETLEEINSRLFL